MSDKLTRKELAEKKGVSHQRIDTLIRQGRLLVDADGLISRQQADEVWANLSPDHVIKEAFLRDKREGGTSPDFAAFEQAKIAQAEAKLKLREFDYNKVASEFLPRAEVQAEAQKIAGALREFLLAFPDQAARELAAAAQLPADQIELAMRRKLTELSRGLITEMIAKIDLISQTQESKNAQSSDGHSRFDGSH